jgi:hypothetical protein
MTFRHRLALVMVALSLTAGRAVAQDSSRADWREWLATRDSVARCRKGQLLSRVYGVEGEFTVHRTPSGGTCQAGPGPRSPTAWVIDSKVFCPDSNPATWMDSPKTRAPRMDILWISCADRLALRPTCTTQTRFFLRRSRSEELEPTARPWALTTLSCTKYSAG